MNTEVQELLDQEFDLFEEQLANWDQARANGRTVSRLCKATAIAIFAISTLVLGTKSPTAFVVWIFGFVLCASVDAIITRIQIRRCREKNKKLDAQGDELLAQITALNMQERSTGIMAVHLRLHPAKPRLKHKKEPYVLWPSWYPPEYIQYLNSLESG